MTKQKLLFNPILIPVIVEASDIAKKTAPISIAVLPKEYTLMSIDVEVIESFGTGATCELGTKDKSDKFAKGIKLDNVGVNTESTTKTTLKSNQELIINFTPTPVTEKGKLCVRIMMFAPSSTYMEV